MNEASRFKAFCAFMRQARVPEPSPAVLLEEWILLVDGQRDWLSPEARAFAYDRTPRC